jgi:hypothetical protein
LAHREIALPLRVRRIALRQAFGDRQTRLVRRQRTWTITWAYPDSVDRCQGSTRISVRVLVNCCS